jgi:hypothetical protein
MHPTFRPGDLLGVEPCRWEDLRPGEVVVFRDPRGGHQVVHRVVAVLPRGLQTQGDNCPEPDEVLIPPSLVVGRVVACERRGQLLPVASEPSRPHVPPRVWEKLARVLGRFLQPLYLRWAGRFAGLLPLRLMCFPRPEGPEWQLWWGKMLVGRLGPRGREWDIRRPFRLFVDERRLPGRPAP